MDKAAIDKQLVRLDDLEERVKEIREKAKQVSQYATTEVFHDALMGEQDFLRPARNRAEYLERVAHYEAKDKLRLNDLLSQAEKLPSVDSQRWDTRREVRIGIISLSLIHI